MDVYERIMRAAKRGTGMRLSADEVWQLSADTAIADAAENAKTQREQEAAENKRWRAASHVARRKGG